MRGCWCDLADRPVVISREADALSLWRLGATGRKNMLETFSQSVEDVLTLWFQIDSALV